MVARGLGYGALKYCHMKVENWLVNVKLLHHIKEDKKLSYRRDTGTCSCPAWGVKGNKKAGRDNPAGLKRL
jgi:hypothetical protein